MDKWLSAALRLPPRQGLEVWDPDNPGLSSPERVPHFPPDGPHSPYPPGYDHGHGLNEAFGCDQLVEAEDLAGGHVETSLWHGTWGQRAEKGQEVLAGLGPQGPSRRGKPGCHLDVERPPSSCHLPQRKAHKRTPVLGWPCWGQWG